MFAIALTTVLIFSPLQSDKIEWKRYDLAKLNMSIVLPATPEPTNVALRSESRKMIQSMETVQVSIPGLFVVASYTHYDNDIITDLQKAGLGAIENIKSQQGVTEFKSTIKQEPIGSLNGLRISGTYKSKGKTIAFEGRIACDNNHLWQINTGYVQGNNESRVFAWKVLDSIKINNN